jgi:cellobiose phosphorylase
MIAPAIPEKWKGFKATRVYRGVRYLIEVKRAGAGSAVQLTVDGNAMAGCVVPLPIAGSREVRVDVKLG